MDQAMYLIQSQKVEDYSYLRALDFDSYIASFSLYCMFLDILSYYLYGTFK